MYLITYIFVADSVHLPKTDPPVACGGHSPLVGVSPRPPNSYRFGYRRFEILQMGHERVQMCREERRRKVTTR